MGKKLFLCCCLFGAKIALAQEQQLFAGFEHLFTTPLQYTARYTAKKPRIDGQLSEQCWKDAPWSADFSDIEGTLKQQPPLATRFKMVWDNNHLYIAAELQEPHLWATIRKRDSIIYRDNDFEIFIDPEGDTRDYYEIEVNALNTIFDLMMHRPYRNGGPAITRWDLAGLQSAVSLDGTLNDPADTDQKWVLEFSIPFKSLGITAGEIRPGTNWRINFSRVQWDTDIRNGSYIKKKDTTTGKFLPEHNWVWSPQGVINMHYPERWGWLRFSRSVDPVIEPASMPADEQAKKYCWLMYYKQQQHRKQTGHYARTLADIQMPAKIECAGTQYRLSLDIAGAGFTATVHVEPAGSAWKIDQEGYLSPVLK